MFTQVKKKMTCEEFIRNNRGINAGENLPPDFLQELYDSISRSEIRWGDIYCIQVTN
jgi:Sec7-like guanine-nucleotide exchange factor